MYLEGVFEDWGIKSCELNAFYYCFNFHGKYYKKNNIFIISTIKIVISSVSSKLINFFIKKIKNHCMKLERKIPYIIEVDANSNYPFNLSKAPKFDVSVKVKLPFQ